MTGPPVGPPPPMPPPPGPYGAPPGPLTQTFGAVGGPPPPPGPPAPYNPYGPAAYPPQAPPPSGGNRGLIIAGIAGAAVLVLVLSIIGGILLVGDDEPTTPTAQSSSSAPSEEPSEEPSEDEPSEDEPSEEEPSDEPTGPPPALKNRPAVSVVGVPWVAGEATETQAYPGWPFAFRAPVGLPCAKSTSPNRGDRVYKCQDTSLPKGQSPEVFIILRSCMDGCTAAEQSRLDVDLPYRPAAPFKARDANTKYVEEEIDVRYQLTVSYYFGGTAGGPLKYQVLMQGRGPQLWRQRIQKTFNDIRTQAAP